MKTKEQKANIKKWITALESGDYEQCRGSIIKYKNPNNDDHPKSTYCCLGVASDVFNVRYASGGENIDYQNIRYMTDDMFEETFGFVGEKLDFVDMNDVQGLSFQEIADHLKGFLNPLF
jgi:hypothetical protein